MPSIEVIEAVIYNFPTIYVGIRTLSRKNMKGVSSKMYTVAVYLLAILASSNNIAIPSVIMLMASFCLKGLMFPPQTANVYIFMEKVIVLVSSSSFLSS